MSKSATSSVFWSAVERFSVQGIQFILSIIIARLVTPYDYGLIAMMAIFIAISNSLVDSGFSIALIQRQDRTEIDFSTAFYYNVFLSIFLYGVLFFISPYIADFYNEPLLSTLLKFSGLNIIITAFSMVQKAKLTINLDFKNQAKYSFISVILSGIVGVFLAYKGSGVWALIVQSLLSNILNVIFLNFVVKWKPLLVFSNESFKKLFFFGSKLMASGLLNTIYLNLYSLVIGKFYNASDVGYYNRAYTFSQFPSVNIVSIISRAMYPIQCQHQNDKEKLKEIVMRDLRATCFIVFPLMIGLAAMSNQVIICLLTEKWTNAIIPLSILSVAYMLYPLMLIDNQIIYVCGRSDLFLKAEIIKKIVAVSFLIIAISYGLYALCLSILLYNIFDTIIIVHYENKVIKLPLFEQISKLIPILLVSLGMGIVVYVSSHFLFSNYSLISLLVPIILGIITYSLLCYLFNIDEFLTLINKIKTRCLTK